MGSEMAFEVVPMGPGSGAAVDGGPAADAAAEK